MARNGSVDNMNFAELSELEARIGKLKIEKQNTEREAVRDKIIAMAKEAGFDAHELFGKGGRGGRGGKIAPKYRDKDGNTWTGRGRPPRWLSAALNQRGVKKDDFLIK